VQKSRDFQDIDLVTHHSTSSLIQAGGFSISQKTQTRHTRAQASFACARWRRVFRILFDCPGQVRVPIRFDQHPLPRAILLPLFYHNSRCLSNSFHPEGGRQSFADAFRRRLEIGASTR
jgi:hypothetical protein